MTNPRVKARIEARIHERAAHCVEFELNDPRSALITITRVELSDDLSLATLCYSVYGSEGDKNRVARMLVDASGFIRKKIGGILRMRRIPELRWIYDDSIEYSARMGQTIQEALEKDRAIHPGAHAEIPPPPADDKIVDQEYLDFLSAQEEEDG
jgi:ribosome-binding factor A